MQIPKKKQLSHTILSCVTLSNVSKHFLRMIVFKQRPRWFPGSEGRGASGSESCLMLGKTGSLFF